MMINYFPDSFKYSSGIPTWKRVVIKLFGKRYVGCDVYDGIETTIVMYIFRGVYYVLSPAKRKKIGN